MTEPETHYIHGSTPHEQQRLAIMNEIINLNCLRELGLTGGERILVSSSREFSTRVVSSTANP